ncbi:MAG TPA: hypothetical protein VGF43_23830 [Dongiaceae bacterium]|jgi:hypothetical protein
MQPDARHYPAEAAGLDLFPITIIACSAPDGQASRLLTLQSAVAKIAGMLAVLRLSSLRLARPTWLRLRAQ